MNMFLYNILLIFFTSVVLTTYSAAPNYYRAAVFEHAMVRDFKLPKKEILDHSLMTFERAAKAASADGADIIVFPEYGIFPHNTSDRSWVFTFGEDIPDPQRTAPNPCDEIDIYKNHIILRRLSCMAKDNSIYVVANVVDAKKCIQSDTCDADSIDSCVQNENCPDDGALLHNTNVAFDRNGNLIARYYKRHLYFEHDMNPISDPKHIYFETDFGNFTTCVCFDLSFFESVKAIETGKVINVAYPTYWYDHAPFLYFAPSFQQSWAIANKVNLLAANVHLPGTGTLGSGIYSSSRGALIYTHNPDGKSKLLISNVPKYIDDNNEISYDEKIFIVDYDSVTHIQEEKPLFQDFCQMDILGMGDHFERDYRCHSTNTTGFVFVKLDKPRDVLNICSNNLCCSLYYDTELLQENYFFGIHAGIYDFRGYLFGSEVCFLMRCEEHKGKPCSKTVLNSNTIFKEIEIKGNFSAKYIYPFAVDSGVRLTKKHKWSFNKNSMKYDNSDANSLLFLGLYGRNYHQDVLLNQ